MTEPKIDKLRSLLAKKAFYGVEPSYLSEAYLTLAEIEKDLRRFKKDSAALHDLRKELGAKDQVSAADAVERMKRSTARLNALLTVLGVEKSNG